MNPFSWFTKSQSELGNAEIRSLFALGYTATDFVRSDILQTYTKILTDVAERTHGLKDEQEKLLWDSCVQTSANEGLITLLAEAMTKKTELFIVVKSGVLRKATAEEEKQIKDDYKKQGESKVGVYVSFKNYRRTELMEIYSGFEYCVLASLNKTLNVAKSVQFKINDLRKSVSLADSSIAREQARSIAEAMRNGNDVLLDKNDEVTSATPDTAPTEKAMVFLAAKKAFILSLPLSYVEGEQTPGIGSTGEADMRAVERGLRQYFVSIVRPTFEALFKVSVTFKTQDFRQVTSALEVIKTFELTSEEYISTESKQMIAAQVFDLDPEEEKKRIEKEAKEREKEAAKAEALRAKNPPVVVQPNGAANGAATGGQTGQAQPPANPPANGVA